MNKFLIVATAALMLVAADVSARGGGGHSSYVYSGHSHAHGTTHRDPKQREAFMHANPCPANGHTSGACPGYVVDHIQALKHGGADAPENMQWQTIAEGKAKDKWE